MPRPRKAPAALDEMADELTVPAVSDLDIARVSRALDASPEEFQAALATIYRGLLVEGLRTIQAPRNLKECKDLAGMIRQAEGLDKADKGSSIPVGMVGVLRSVQRRAVVDAEVMDDEVPGFE